jgi:cephalosporin hydroxylase
LFAEERIQTFYVDQLDLSSFDELSRQTPEQLDLVIDDGLHSPAANIAVLTYAARKQRAGGWVVIEDIVQAALPVWQVVAQLLDGWACQIIQARSGFMFVANRPLPPTMA